MPLRAEDGHEVQLDIFSMNDDSENMLTALAVTSDCLSDLLARHVLMAHVRRIHGWSNVDSASLCETSNKAENSRAFRYNLPVLA